MNKSKVHNFVHFIGIGGISMSGIAHILLKRGVKVSGSDRSSSNIIKILEADGATICIGHNAENITTQDLVVYTAAISDDNPELVAAREKGIQTMERADFLGELMLDYKMPISISGTHGKTTTTSMLSSVLLHAEEDPTILVGGELNIIGGNYRTGADKYLVFEGCEYVDSFLKFNPYASIILNIEEDHLDYFKDINQIKQSFNKFMKKIPEDGFVIVNADDENVMDSLDDVKCEIITYGVNGQYSYNNVAFDENGYGSFDVCHNGQKLCRIKLSVGGNHNITNALAVFAAAHKMGVASDIIVEGINKFNGTKRRFEYKGCINGAKIFDDYAHHPTEISATFDTAKKMEHNEIWVVFQPHTYTRTKALFDNFISALQPFDHVIVTDIYAAREKNTVGISSDMLANKIKDAQYISEFSEIAAHLKSNLKPNDVVITMGAGTITDLSKFLLDSI